MALETRPIPVLTGKVARDFYKTLAKCTVSETREEVQELKRKWFPVIEAAMKREQEERMKKTQND
jgi:hypothetical protein